MGKRIEIFTADCPICKEAIEMIKREACSECEIIEQRCIGNECCESAKGYGIKAVPTIVVNGKVAFVGKPTLEEVKKLFA
jgi:glutaredoxin